jgi:23S rRNA pseudouridine1911/1915/1917 synthase
MKVEETVPGALDGERIDRIVSIIADISRSDATKLIADGGAEVDGVLVSSGKPRLKEGQIVVVDLNKIPVEELPGPDASVVLDVVYVDDDIIVINKSAGMVVHPASSHGTGTVVNGILALYPEAAWWQLPHLKLRVDCLRSLSCRDPAQVTRWYTAH